MNYTERLNMIIDDSGMMLKDIAEACQKEGVKLTNTYLSSLKTTPGKIASDEISRAIAKVCGAKYEDILVAQAYLDKAPDIFTKFVEICKQQSDYGMKLMLQNAGSEDVKNALVAMQDEQDGTLAEQICRTLELYSNSEDIEEYQKALEAESQKRSEPKCMIISAEQLKNVRFVNEDELTEILKDKH